MSKNQKPFSGYVCCPDMCLPFTAKSAAEGMNLMEEAKNTEQIPMPCVCSNISYSPNSWNCCGLCGVCQCFGINKSDLDVLACTCCCGLLGACTKAKNQDNNMCGAGACCTGCYFSKGYIDAFKCGILGFGSGCGFFDDALKFFQCNFCIGGLGCRES